jgi:hypothetical protein
MEKKIGFGLCECELGGDENDCKSCAYYPDYKFNKEKGLCVICIKRAGGK